MDTYLYIVIYIYIHMNFIFVIYLCYLYKDMFIFHCLLIQSTPVHTPKKERQNELNQGFVDLALGKWDEL